MVQLVKKFILFACLGLISLKGFGQCTEDCVWPGDLNANGIVNALDALAFGFALDSTGPARSNMSTDWQALEADDWTQILPELGTNFKHIDANGNGIVEENDQFTISVNYNFTNDNFVARLGNEIAGDDLFAIPNEEAFTPGQSIFLEVHLGDAANPINDIYGIGFQLKLDTQYVEDVIFNFENTWIGGPGDVFSYGKYSDQADHVGIAVTRIDGSPISGFGEIVEVEIVITDVILGLEMDTTECLPFLIEFENVLGIDIEGEDMLISSKPRTVQLKHPSQINNTENLDNTNPPISLYPNPTNGQLSCVAESGLITNLSLYNQYGQQILTVQPNSHNHSLDLEHLPAGVYLFEVQTTTGKSLQRLVIQ